MTTTPKRAHLPTLLAIITLAAILRAAVASPDACISRDGVWFVEMAKKLADDPVRHMQIETKQPGFSWLLLAAHSAFGGEDSPESWQATGALLAGIGGVAVCALLYFIALWLFDRKVAAVTGIFAACWPQGVQLSADVLSDMPHLALYLSVLTLLAAGRRRFRGFRWLAAGALAGLAFWFRLEALGLLPAGICWALFANASPAATPPGSAAIHDAHAEGDPDDPSRSPAWGMRIRWAIVPVVLYLVGFGVVAGQYVAIARLSAPSDGSSTEQRSGAPAHEAAFATAHTRVPCHRVPCRLQRSACSAPSTPTNATMLANAVAPPKLPGRMAEEWARSGRYVFAALFLASLFIKTMPRGARPLAWLCGLAATFQLVLVAARVLKYGELSSRYMLVPIALTIPWAASAFVHLVQAAIRQSSDTSRYKFIPIWATGLMLAIFPLLYYATRPINAGRLTLREAGEWLRSAATPDAIILADDQNLQQVRYYANRNYPNEAKWERLQRDAGAAARDEAINRIQPAWFVTMIDKPDEATDAKALAADLCRSLTGYEIANVFENDARPVIILKRTQ